LACGPGTLEDSRNVDELDDCHLFHDHSRVISRASCPEGGNYAPLGPGFGSPIEGYSDYVGQSSCDPPEKAGVAAFRAFVNQTYPCTGDLGISRACSVGGLSEHKEGRAWDWQVNASHPSAQALVDWLLATDEHGNRDAMARRLGIMYMIWNRQIWRSYRAEQGWQPYGGTSPHTDHIHFSFSWVGARGTSSFWEGVRDEDDSSYGSCYYAGAEGSCQDVSAPCEGAYRGSLCPGPATVECCMPTADPPTVVSSTVSSTWGDCTSEQVTGAQTTGSCQDISDPCDGTFEAGLCPGPASIRCCLPGSLWGTCSYDGQSGQCQETTQHCEGAYRAGLCPGPALIRCCL
ncbi:MAG: hypothetical protein JRH20_14550, partial [Deltaproteobacteria bacterium]|nr:hypothetical protein [Deltaproteobacteria bacterium]